MAQNVATNTDLDLECFLLEKFQIFLNNTIYSRPNIVTFKSQKHKIS